MGAYGEHSSRLRNFEGFKLVTNLKETKEAKCKVIWCAIQFSKTYACLRLGEIQHNGITQHSLCRDARLSSKLKERSMCH